MRPTVLAFRNDAELVLTCEHASSRVPDELGDLGMEAGHRDSHIGWDLGTAWLTTELSRVLSVPAVLSPVSRLVVDCNRDLAEPDLMPALSHGVVIPANRSLTIAERQRRLQLYYWPFHDEVDRVVAASPEACLLSLHSFTPEYEDRDFDIGILFDDFESDVQVLSHALTDSGFRVRLNEPYSGFDGLIHSAQTHGRRAGVCYLELEINNVLLVDREQALDVAGRIAAALPAWLSRARDEGGWREK